MPGRDLGPANELPATKFSDLNMLVSLGGPGRTIDAYAHLMRQDGLRLVGSTPGAFDLQIIAGAPAWQHHADGFVGCTLVALLGRTPGDTSPPRP